MANNDDLVFAALSAAKHAADGVPDAVADWLNEHVDPETGYVVDDTLTIEGAAADAKAVGDRLASDGLTDAIRQALLQLAAKVAYIDDDGQDYYDDLYAALYNGEYWAVTNTLTGCTTSNPAASITKNAAYSATITASAGYTLTGATVSITMGGTDITSTAYNNGTISIASVTGALVIAVTAAAKTLSSISAVYTQSGTVYDTDSLDSLKYDLVVTATYDDSSTAVVSAADYTLSGTLAEGTSTITVTYGGKTATFSVTVTAWDDYNYSVSNGQLYILTAATSGYNTSAPLYGRIGLYFGSANRRSFPTKIVGVKPMSSISESGNVIGETEYYPIRIPNNAVKAIVSITPSSQFTGSSFYTYANGNYIRQLDPGWKQGSYTYEFTAGQYEYMTVASKYNSAGTSYPTEPTAVSVQFSTE